MQQLLSGVSFLNNLKPMVAMVITQLTSISRLVCFSENNWSLVTLMTGIYSIEIVIMLPIVAQRHSGLPYWPEMHAALAP